MPALLLLTLVVWERLQLTYLGRKNLPPIIDEIAVAKGPALVFSQRLLGAAGSRSPDFAPSVQTMLEHQDPQVRASALVATLLVLTAPVEADDVPTAEGKSTPILKLLVPAIESATRDEDRSVGELAELVLATIDLRSIALPQRSGEFRPEEFRAHMRAELALNAKYANGRSGEIFAKFFHHEDELVRGFAAMHYTLLEGERGDKVPEAIRGVIEAGHTPWFHGAHEILVTVGKAAVPELIALVRGDDERACLDAKEALAHLGKDARLAIPALREKLADQSAPIRDTAAAVIARIEEDEAIRSEHPRARTETQE